jgi:putative ABC transport system ATP-binding protein
MMITHDISLALAFGTRTAMMDEGRFIFDFSGSERKSLSVEKLMKMYSQKAEKELSSDRMLLKNR